MPPLHEEYIDDGGCSSSSSTMDINLEVVSGERGDHNHRKIIELTASKNEETIIRGPRPRRCNNRSATRFNNNNNNRGGGAAIVMLAMTALLIIGSSQLLSSVSAGEVQVPDGLLFASEMIGYHDDSSALRGPPSSSETTSSSMYSKTQPEIHQRTHPIHKIYRDNAHIRRRVEELENSSPYFQTGIRGDPSHKLTYMNHPFDLKRKERELKERMLNNNEEHAEKLNEEYRKLQEEQQETETSDPFAPIRIHFDTTALDSELTSDNGSQIDFVKNIILPRMSEFWSTALSVVPVVGNLMVSSADLQGRLYCGDTEFSKVPAEHIATGIPNSDLVLYVSGAPSARFCGPSTLAVAVACNFDQFDRPTAGKFVFVSFVLCVKDRRNGGGN